MQFLVRVKITISTRNVARSLISTGSLRYLPVFPVFRRKKFVLMPKIFVKKLAKFWCLQNFSPLFPIALYFFWFRQFWPIWPIWKSAKMAWKKSEKNLKNFFKKLAFFSCRQRIFPLFPIQIFKFYAKFFGVKTRIFGSGKVEKFAVGTKKMLIFWKIF